MEKFPVLETERLVLREASITDAVDMFVYLSDREVTTPMGIPPYITANDVFNEEISWYKAIASEGTGMRWVITEKDSDVVIGSCGFLNMSREHHRAEIGFELNKTSWGRGIASEAVAAVVDYGYSHLNLNRIEAIVDPSNLSSQKVLEKQAFMKEGLLRHYEYNFGKFSDVLMYALVKEEYKLRNT